MIPPTALLARLARVAVLLLALGSVLVSAVQPDERGSLVDHQPSYETENQHVLHPSSSPQDAPSTSTATNALRELHSALETMQDLYFALNLGKWPEANDWTAAVMNTHLSAALSSLSNSLPYTLPGTFDKARKLDVEAQMVENEINKYFSQSVTYFFGEDYFSIRNQAYDDMLWVVLGWLGSVRFIGTHSEGHYPVSTEGNGKKEEKGWHGKQFVPSFAHRARVFYELAEKGWDWHLCGGGMVWSPYLLPYKNAITNQLFIAGSVGMYLHFPGDDDCSPFIRRKNENEKTASGAQEQGSATACPSNNEGSTYDPKYLANAVNGYKWLQSSGMTNSQGLYVDGFHIKDYAQNHSKTECNERNEMVYTYNQGVILSGLRGLWEATGTLPYLEDGHELIRNVIAATGWTDTDMSKTKTKTYLQKEGSFVWAGLGSSGILTELCDPSGTCNQDGHTFKGIFFQHLTSFCAPLPTTPTRPGKTHAASRLTAKLHRASCNEYAPWVMHNVNAALRTRDAKGRFGGWWGADIDPPAREHRMRDVDILPKGARDYRNEEGVRGAFVWKWTEFEAGRVDRGGDLNDRGRGRTVETQGGGVAVVRAMWEFLSNIEAES